MMWFIAWAITALLLLGAMVLNTRMVLRNQKTLGTLEAMRKELKTQNNLILRLAQEVGEATLKQIEEAQDHA
jgi:hypothetical protein